MPNLKSTAGGGSSEIFITGVYAPFNTIMNPWAMFQQLFIVSRIFKRSGVRGAIVRWHKRRTRARSAAA